MGQTSVTREYIWEESLKSRVMNGLPLKNILTGNSQSTLTTLEYPVVRTLIFGRNAKVWPTFLRSVGVNNS